LPALLKTVAFFRLLRDAGWRYTLFIKELTSCFHFRDAGVGGSNPLAPTNIPVYVTITIKVIATGYRAGRAMTRPSKAQRSSGLITLFDQSHDMVDSEGH